MANTQRIRAIRQRLYEQDPYCYWCGVRVYENGRSDGRCEWNTSTLDHLWAKRGDKVIGAGYVLACFRCNHTRGRMVDEFPKIIVRAESSPKKAFPRGIRALYNANRGFKIEDFSTAGPVLKALLEV